MSAENRKSESNNAAGEPKENEPSATDGNGQATSEPEGEQPEEKDPLEAAQQEIAKTRDQLLRTAADFDNYRKRARREAQDLERRAREDMLRDMLPVFDNLERAAQHAGSAKDVQSLADGISMVMRQFVDTLGKLGVERLATVGQAFDPSVHEAIQQLETDEYPPGSVASEVQAGYRMGDRLIRPAMVVVAKPATK
ncbi:MAG TPA: nucleotide exchange factor GrpE [Polyangiaceae bacterium]|nr:nucleotide exchange factor GrpE [Polyangiaceae bacterium]